VWYNKTDFAKLLFTGFGNWTGVPYEIYIKQN